MTKWDEGLEHVQAMAAARAAGGRAYRGWKSQNWPVDEAVAATVLAAVDAYVSRRNELGGEGWPPSSVSS